jgi:hypothetical protein
MTLVPEELTVCIISVFPAIESFIVGALKERGFKISNITSIQSLSSEELADPVNFIFLVRPNGTKKEDLQLIRKKQPKAFIVVVRPEGNEVVDKFANVAVNSRLPEDDLFADFLTAINEGVTELIKPKP